MGETQYFGLSKFGAEGRISDENYKFALRDRETLDSILYTLATHDHRTTSSSEALAGPTNINLTQSTTGGSLVPGTSYYYKVSFRDAAGNETDSSPTEAITTPYALAPPPVESISYVTTGGNLEAGLYRYALSYYQSTGGETKAPNYGSVYVNSGTSTNINTITLTAPPNDADGWKVYRRGPNEDEYNYLATIAATATPSAAVHSITGLKRNTDNLDPFLRLRDARHQPPM